MLKNSFTLGMLAAFAVAPVAYGGQAPRNDFNTRISAGNTGIGYVNDIDSSTYTDQYQGKNNNLFCTHRNQVQRNTSNTGNRTRNIGLRDTRGASSSRANRQSQNADCSFPYYR